MALAYWTTPAGSLGTIPELKTYSFTLGYYNPNNDPISFSVIAGALPDGLAIVGNTIAGTPSGISVVTTSEFTIRLTDANGGITDRTFNLTVAGLVQPKMYPASGNLTPYFSNHPANKSLQVSSYTNVTLTFTESTSTLTPVFTLVSGTLPPNLTLSPNGAISGYVSPVNSSNLTAGLDDTPFDAYGFDFYQQSTNYTFQFTIQATDGINLDKQVYTATVDPYTPPYAPVLYTPEGFIGSIRENTNFYFKFDAIDFDNEPVTYNITIDNTHPANPGNVALPSGLSLNSTTGWLNGIVSSTSFISTPYYFAVYARNNSGIPSETKYYSLTLLGQIDNTVIWNTSGNLGSVYNGDISLLSVSATTNSNSNISLSYSLVTNGGLPPGLVLLSDGSISGRISFNLFNSTQESRSYSFTIAASSSDELAYGTQTFTLTVLKRDAIPFNNIYIMSLPNSDQRNIYNNFISDGSIFPPQYIFRPLDPWFGSNDGRRSLFITGLNPVAPATYVDAIMTNHYNKSLNYGDVKVAQALDDNFNVIYEVVYVDLLDPETNSAGFGPPVSITWPPNSANISTVYPNSLTNMTTVVGAGVGYENRSIMPLWMTSRQKDGSVLGFTRALVLCYTLPNYGAEIAYRASQNLNTLKLVDFTIDRYEVDNILSSNYVVAPYSGTGYLTISNTSPTVTGYGTNFTVAPGFKAGQSIYVYNPNTNAYSDTIGVVANIQSNTQLTLTANSTLTYPSIQYEYSSNIWAPNSFTICSSYITANIQSAIVTGSNVITSGTGTISGTTTNANIYGTGTTFTTQLIIGNPIYYNGTTLGTITRVWSSNIAQLSAPLAQTLTNVSFSIQGATTLFTQELHLGDQLLVNISNANVILGTISNITSDTSLILSENSTANVSAVAYYHTTQDPYTVPGQGDAFLKFTQYNILA